MKIAISTQYSYKDIKITFWQYFPDPGNHRIKPLFNFRY